MKQIIFFLFLGFCSCFCPGNCDPNHCPDDECEKCLNNYVLFHLTCLACSDSTCGSCDGSRICVNCKSELETNSNNTIENEYQCSKCIDPSKVHSSGKCYTPADVGCVDDPLPSNIDKYRRCKAQSPTSCKLPFVYNSDEDTCVGSVVFNCAKADKYTSLCIECAPGYTKANSAGGNQEYFLCTKNSEDLSDSSSSYIFSGFALLITFFFLF